MNINIVFSQNALYVFAIVKPFMEGRKRRTAEEEEHLLNNS